jgi:hypothetical protein
MRDQNQPELLLNEQQDVHSCLNLAFTPETTEQFCQNLPTHDIIEATKQLYTFLLCLNHHQLDLTVRYQISSLLMTKIDYIFEVLLKQYFSSFAHNLTLQQHNIPVLIENLFSLSKESYQIITRNQLGKFFAKKEILANCLAHCLRMNLKLLFIHFLAYKKPPKYLWIECHNLYQLAQKKNILNKILPELDKEISHHCILDWYKHLLLFSIANPYRLRAQDTLLLYHALTFWTKYMEIESIEHIEDELFSLDLSKDSPPVYSSLALFPVSKNTRVLVLKKLTTYLDKFLTGTNIASSSEKNLPPALIKQLISTWSYFSNRGQDRVALYQPAKVFIGLHGVIQALSVEKSAPLSQFSDCTIVNESPGGFCLEFDTQNLKVKQPQTGDLLGLNTQIESKEEGVSLEPQAQQGGQQLTVGIIRWVKQLDSTKMQCGLQLIGHRPLTISIQIISDNEKELVGEPHQILFIPEMAAFGRKESIVSPSMPFKTGMKIKLVSPTQETANLPFNTPVKLLEVVLSTSNFKQFFIQVP